MGTQDPTFRGEQNGLGSSSFYFISYGSGYIAQDGFNFFGSSASVFQANITGMPHHVLPNMP